MSTKPLINKSMDRADLFTEQGRKVCQELNDLVRWLDAKQLTTSAWYGWLQLTGEPLSFEQMNRGLTYEALPDAVDDLRFPWFLYWEIAWLMEHAGFEPGQKVLDLGGSCSLFAYYLASKGFDVVTVDLQQKLVDIANDVAQKTGWKLRNYAMDMRRMNFNEKFDHITSVCVFEHIPMYDRVEINKGIRDLLVEGGRFSITFDYRNPSRFARINTPQDVDDQFVKPSGLKIRGNYPFHDTEKNWLLHPFYHPNAPFSERWLEFRRGHFGLLDMLRRKQEDDYSFGALFMEKR
jgi:2-polyprenyl-3-methyl-5-hydroxy-6-metoxy-1,4-benzoquinol methylase